MQCKQRHALEFYGSCYYLRNMGQVRTRRRVISRSDVSYWVAGQVQ